MCREAESHVHQGVAFTFALVLALAFQVNVGKTNAFSFWRFQSCQSRRSRGLFWVLFSREGFIPRRGVVQAFVGLAGSWRTAGSSSAQGGRRWQLFWHAGLASTKHDGEQKRDASRATQGEGARKSCETRAPDLIRQARHQPCREAVPASLPCFGTVRRPACDSRLLPGPRALPSSRLVRAWEGGNHGILNTSSELRRNGNYCPSLFV